MREGEEKNQLKLKKKRILSGKLPGRRIKAKRKSQTQIHNIEEAKTLEINAK